MEIKYEGEKLVLSGMDCKCGMNHVEPDMDIYIGNGILKNCASYFKKRNFGKKALLVADNITYGIAGKKVETLMKEAGFDVSLCLLEREHELEPDESALGEILFALDKDTDFLVSVGSGSITDLTRYVAFNTKRPFVSVGTAASMDGYTSVVAPLLNKGVKVNRPSTHPKVLVCDIDIIKNAPYDMMYSGFGDVLGKYIAKADWIAGRIINGEQYCPMCADLAVEAVEKCIANADGIRNRTDEGIKSLIEALILAGITILIIGNTRPVASAEHNMAHYWEMMKLLKKEKAPAHGTSVGVATAYAMKFFEHFLQSDFTKVDKAAVRSKAKTRQQREKEMIEYYGVKAGTSIMKENPEDFLDWSEQERRIDAIVNNIDKIREELKFLPSSKEVIEILKKVASPLTAEEIGVEDELLKKALMCAKDYRSRYTLFKSADEVGLLEEIVEKVLKG